ncbi:MAG: caspase family protein [Brasilonema octagenarum HA4186-MV1]|jgi:WD40 repeat protein|nr:caspase family protein [Brasilonema octagenarum HA4186-MV1]
MSKNNFNRSFAIILGINNYENDIPKLETAAPDALKLAQIIQDQHTHLKQQYQAQNQYEVQLLLNQRVTLKKLRELIENFKKGQIFLDNKKVTVTKDDRVLFYFAGHGIADNAMDNEDGPVGYLIPQDATDDKSTYLPMQDLHDALNALPCRHMLAILDCCFAGAFRWGSLKRNIVPKVTVYKERYDRFISDAAWQVITSAADDQKALDSLGQRGTVIDGDEIHSPFAKALFDALRGGPDEGPDFNKDGIITATELYSYLRDQVEILTEKHYKRQTPGFCPLKKHDKGEFIFLLPNFERDKLADAPPLNVENNPYRGLQSYDEKDSSLFFGRENLIKQLYQHVVSEQHALTVVLGASGTGKSSLMKAGFLPRLRHCQEYQFQILQPMRPGENPLQALAQVCSPIATAITAEELAKDEYALATIVENRCKADPKTQLLLPIDQFEELITLCNNDQEREQFQKLIKNAIAKFSKHIDVVVTLRLDFEAQFQNSVLKDFWNDARFVVPPMTQDELREAIEKPPSEKVVYFDPPSLVDELINEVVQMPGALPLLSFTLSELYLKYLEQRRDNRALTKEDYKELGRVVGSLTKRANQEYDRLVAEDVAYQNTVRWIMLRMISLQGRELARRQVPKSELVYPDKDETERVNTVIQRLSETRLIVEGSNSQGEPYVEPAHDALVQGWDKMLKWKKDEEENLILQQRLTPAANDWHNEERPESYLWNTNPRLDLLQEVIKNSQENWLNQLEMEFVKSSIVKRDEEDIKDKKQIIRILYRAAEALLAANQKLEALVEAVKAGKELKKLQLKYSFWKDAELCAQVRRTLQKTMYGVKERNRLNIPNDSDKVVFSPNGQLLAIAQVDGTVSLWDRTGKQLSGFKPFNVGGQVWSFSFSPDSQQLITVSTDEVVKWWNLNGQQVGKDLKQPGIINQVMLGSNGRLMIFSDNKLRDLESGTQLAEFPDEGIGYDTFSPDGKLIATGTAGDTISIWNVDSKKKIVEIKDFPFFNSNIPVSISFSPDSKFLAAAGYQDDTVYLWDLKGNQLAKFNANQNGIKDISFSPDGKQLATIGIDATLRIWQNLEGKQLAELSLDDVSEISVSSDGQLLAVSDSQRIILWNLRKRQQVSQFPQQFTDISELHFSADNHLLAVSEYKGTIHLLDLENQQQLDTFKGNDIGYSQGTFTQQNYGLFFQGLSLSKDGNLLAIGGDNTITVRSRNGEQLVTFPEGPAPEEGNIVPNWVQATAFDPSGNLLASSTVGGTVRLWNWKQRKEILPNPIEANTTQTFSVVFSPKGNLIATAGLDGSTNGVRLWNLSGEKLAEFKGHLGKVNQVIFSPDGSLLATAGNDGTARIWDLSGQQLAEFKGFDWVESMAFSPDSKQLVTVGFTYGTNDSPGLWRAALWQIEDLDELLVRGCEWVGDYLKNHPNVDESDRHLCDDVPSTAANPDK